MAVLVGVVLLGRGPPQVREGIVEPVPVTMRRLVPRGPRTDEGLQHQVVDVHMPAAERGAQVSARHVQLQNPALEPGQHGAPEWRPDRHSVKASDPAEVADLMAVVPSDGPPLFHVRGSGVVGSAG